MADYRLTRLDDENAGEWEEFNEHSAEGSLFHTPRWKEVLARTSEEREHYFLLFKDGNVVGLFPFIERDIGLFRGLVPPTDPLRLPAVLEDYTDPGAIPGVIGALQKVKINGKKISFVCFSTVHEEPLNTIPTHPLLPWANDGDMVLKLAESPPETIWNTLSSRKRGLIRKFEKDGFSVAEGQSREDLEIFYKYYEANINTIGGKLQPFSYFAELCDSMAEETRITVLSDGSSVAGGMFMLRDKPHRTLYLSYLSLNRELPNKYSPTLYLSWEAINWARENKCERISFGAQHLDESNPRYKAKHDLGARFVPFCSRMVPLTKPCSLGMAGMNIWGQWRASFRETDST